jgi:5-methylcytosine-specific restriction endonuclease McrA
MSNQVKHLSPSTFRHRHRGRFFNYPERYIEDVDPRKLFESQDGICSICHEPITDRYEVDHEWPISLGGTHEYDNLQCVHPQCHLYKTNHIEPGIRRQWAASRRYAAELGQEIAKQSFERIMFSDSVSSNG